jgi:hypothetical protein
MTRNKSDKDKEFLNKLREKFIQKELLNVFNSATFAVLSVFQNGIFT